MEQFKNAASENQGEKPKSANELRLERETAIAEGFKKNGYIDSYELYADPKNYLEKPLNAIPEDVQPYVELVKEALIGPVLKDSIEDTFDEMGRVYRGVREGIKNAVQKEGPESMAFWQSNRLESSRLMQGLHAIVLLNEEEPLPENVMSVFRDMITEYSSEGSPLSLDGQGYFKMSNKEKYDFEERQKTLLESALDCVFTKYSK